MADDYGRPEWREDEVAATAEAERRIQALIAAGEDTLDLSDLTALTALPSALARATSLRNLFAGDRRPTARMTRFVDHGLNDVASLRTLTGLLRLDVSGTRVSDLGPLAGLTALTSLDVSGTGVRDLAPLAGLTALTSLDMRGTRVFDLGPLAGLTALTSLDVIGTGVFDLGPLAGLTALTSLDMRGTGVSDLGPLAGLTALTSLDVIGTGVSDLGPLAGLTALTSLDVIGTGVSDLGPLAGLTALTSLDMSHTGVSDLGPLAGLTALTSLDMSGTELSDLSILLQLPHFADGSAVALSIHGIPAADPRRDLRLSGLSNLPLKECAVEVVRHLREQGEDLDHKARPLVDRLTEASPVGLAVREGQLVAVNAGSPERDRPGERATRLVALRAHLSQLIEEAATRQVPNTVRSRLAAYATPLADAEPTFLLLDGPMAFIRGGLADPYTIEGLDGGFVQGWRQLCAMHDDLRPLLLPPEEPDQPQPAPEATPEDAIRATDRAIEVLEASDLVSPSVTDGLSAAKDYFEAAKAGGRRAGDYLRRGLIVVGHTVGTIVGAVKGAGEFVTGVTTVGLFLATPVGQSLIAKLRPIWEVVRALFAG